MFSLTGILLNVGYWSIWTDVLSQLWDCWLLWIGIGRWFFRQNFRPHFGGFLYSL